MNSDCRLLTLTLVLEAPYFTDEVASYVPDASASFVQYRGCASSVTSAQSSCTAPFTIALPHDVCPTPGSGGGGGGGGDTGGCKLLSTGKLWCPIGTKT